MRSPPTSGKAWPVPADEADVPDDDEADAEADAEADEAVVWPGGAESPAPCGAETPAPCGADTPAPGGADTPAPSGADTPAPTGVATPAPRPVICGGAGVCQQYRAEIGTRGHSDLGMLCNDRGVSWNARPRRPRRAPTKQPRRFLLEPT